ncbi:hypothetical protein OPV22_024116 [Ensete ventricosum]|uniref:ABC1 atypical kinase-like domain-containing protein n=1 Tax=Ensete ventricosum TaxID=4639 RepID=A0AAV8QTU4_ENSVE|nr:hypothetical protein OPV22_024116 [Ensete ventricosum]
MMSRFLACQKIRKIGYSFLANSRANYSTNLSGLCSTDNLPLPCRLFSQYKGFCGRNNMFMLHKAEENVFQNNPLRKFSLLSAGSSMTYHAQVAWKRLCAMYTYRGITSSPLSRIVCTTSLALTRSHLVPSILAFVAGEIALSKTAWADVEYFPSRNGLYTVVALTSEKFGFILFMLHWRMQAPAHSFAYTRKSIEKAFGRKLSDVFENFEEEPVASGSVAQVHRASLRFQYPGQQAKHLVVAVKVRHPGVGESIRRDFTIINLAAKISNFIPTVRWLRLDESVQQFAVFMMSQVDLSREAAHLSRFIYNFRRWKDVSFPKPLYPFVHPAVLVETYEHGESVSHYVDELEGHSRLKSALAHIGTHALLKMLLVDNFIHADMHPGNILVRAQTKHPNKGIFKSKPHVVFLDVGMTAELSSCDRVNLLDFFKAVALHDGRTAAECTLKLSKNQNCPNPKAFIEEVEKSFSFWGSSEGDSVHPAECMHQLLEQVRRHKVNIDGNVCTVMVTTLVLEGWQRKLDPDYDVMQTLKELLFRSDWARQHADLTERILEMNKR